MVLFGWSSASNMSAAQQWMGWPHHIRQAGSEPWQYGDGEDLAICTVDPMQLFRTYLLPGFLPSLRTKGGPIGFQGGRIDSCCSIFELF